MEGPTPVSALIHAATMVTAGVYLIARMHPLFEQAPAAADVGAIVGCLTLLIAATIGLVVTDLKRVIAYSTMSQIGYMIMARRVGRLRRRPVPPDDARLLQGAALHGRRLGDRGDGAATRTSTGWAASARRCRSRSPAWIIGGLALSGFPPFSGFFSKDDILARRSPRGRLAHRARCARLRRRAADRDLHVPDDLPRLLRRSVEDARELEHGHLHHAAIRRTPRPASRRTPTSASPARSTTSPSGDGR